MSKRIGLDLDGVLFDFNTHFVNLARSKYPDRNIPHPSDAWPTHWNYIREFLSRHEEGLLWREIKESDFWRFCPSYAHAAELLNSADARADELYFITSRPGTHHVQEQSLSALNSIVHTYGGVIIVKHPEDKAPLIKAMQLTHFVDDKKETVRDILEQCPTTRAAVWDQPWNREWNFPTRLMNVEDFRNWVN